MALPRFRPLEEILRHVKECLGGDRDRDAVTYLRAETGKFRALLDETKAAYQAQLIGLQRRVREHSMRARAIKTARERLFEQLAGIVAGDWPERETLIHKLRGAIANVAVPEEIPIELNLEALGRLDAAEGVATASETAMQELKTSFEREVHEIHRGMVMDQMMAALDSLPEPAPVPPTEPMRGKDEDKTEEKLDALFARIMALKGTGGWTALVEKAAVIRAETSIKRRQMLYRGLVIDCSNRLHALEKTEQWQGEIDRLLDGVAHLTGAQEIEPLVKELLDLKRSGQVGPLDGQRKRVEDGVKKAEQRLAREKRRAAVLQSLHDLGYETSEGMETALVRAGKLVVQKPGDDEYAIEIIANEDLSLLQTSMIRYADTQESSEQQRLRDVAKEESWCGEHSQLIEGMAKRGYDAEFKLKKKPGELPVQVIIDETKRRSKRRAAERTTMQNRSAMRSEGP